LETRCLNNPFKNIEMKKIRVIVADDHPAFKEGFCRLLADEKELEVIGQAGDGEKAVTLSKIIKPDVAIVDVTMPKLSGIEATKRIKKISPNSAVLIVSAFNYQTYILAALRVGAAGYLTKDTPAHELVEAIRLADAGNSIIDRSS
jgi:two-component system, NarL family, response regulator LiaR